jgi:hypothetical protein
MPVSNRREETIAAVGQALEILEKKKIIVDRFFWDLGDVAVWLQDVHGYGPNESYDAVAAVVGKSRRWGLELAKVARAFPKNRRDYSIPWHCYRKAYRTEGDIWDNLDKEKEAASMTPSQRSRYEQ